MLKHLHSVNNSRFYSNFLNMVEQNNLSTLDPGRLGTDIIRGYTKNMKRNIIYVSGDTALSIHRNQTFIFKGEYSTSDYLYQLRNFSERRNLVQLKISNHKLVIELGRYQIDHTPRENV